MEVHLYDDWYELLNDTHTRINGTKLNISLQDTTTCVLHYINHFPNMTKLILSNIQHNTLISHILQNTLHLCHNLKEIILDFEYFYDLTLETQNDISNLFQLIYSNNTIEKITVINRYNHEFIMKYNNKEYDINGLNQLMDKLSVNQEHL